MDNKDIFRRTNDHVQSSAIGIRTINRIFKICDSTDHLDEKFIRIEREREEKNVSVLVNNFDRK